MLDPGAHSGLRPVDQALEFLGGAALAHLLVGAVHRTRRLGPNQLLLRGIRAVTVDPIFLAVQQIGQRVLVVHVGRRDHRAVRQAGLAVHADVQLHAEVPLLALAGLMHLRVTLLVLVLGGAGRTDDRGVHDRAATDLHPLGLQHLAHLGEQGLAQLVSLQQATKLQQRGRVRHPLAAQVDADKATQRRAVQQRLLARRIGQIEPVLHEVHPQHALQPHRGTTVARLRVVRLDHPAQLTPRHDLLHRRQERISPRRPAVLFVLRVLIDAYCQGLLLHVEDDACSMPAGDLISIALRPLVKLRS